MALNPGALKMQLQTTWLNGSFSSDALTPANLFASAVASWFSAAQAAGFLCSTAGTRKGQLVLLSAEAFSSGLTSNDPATPAQQLAQALSAYMTGQLFGAGVAAAPMGTAAATGAFTRIFADLSQETSLEMRAQGFSEACQALAITTLVTFPPSVPPIPPSPVM